MYISRAMAFHLIISLSKQINPSIKTLHPHLLKQKLEPPAGVIPFANGDLFFSWFCHFLLIF
jgi:hypothetical protein